jgi:hypothetical protein
MLLLLIHFVFGFVSNVNIFADCSVYLEVRHFLSILAVPSDFRIFAFVKPLQPGMIKHVFYQHSFSRILAQ